MNWRQFRRGDANLELKGKNSQSMMFCDPLKPFLHRMRKLQLASTGFQADFKTADGGNINGGSRVNFFQRRAA